MDTSPLVEDCLKRSQRLYSGAPSWAWQYPPSYPLVGQSFTPGASLLVYASAENFSWMARKDAPEWFRDGDRVWNRYRACYDAVGRSAETFFPDVGIQPVSDGGLFAAALFASELMGLPSTDKPRTFLEHVAFTNWGKFTVKSDGNEDYATNEDKLVASLPFVVAELAVLQPKAALVPKTIWQNPLLQAAMRGASPFTTFLAVPQFNATVVNVHLNAYAEKAPELKRRLAQTPLADWMKYLVGFNKENAWRYLACLEDLLSEPNLVQ